MLTKVEVFGPVPLILPLGENESNTDPIQIRDVQGLGPVKANVNTTPFGSFDGESYTGSSVGKRNIVLTLGLNPNWKDQSITSLRQLLYTYFMPKRSVTLHFFSDTMSTVKIDGYIEGFEPNMFSKDPEIQVSIICPLPDFVEITPITATGVVDDIDFGAGSSAIQYKGTVPTGFVLRIEEIAGTPAYTGSFTIERSPNGPGMFIFEATVNTDQYVEMSSIRGKKYVRSTNLATGVTTNLLRSVNSFSKWIDLAPGENSVFVYNNTGGQKWTLTYFNRYGGL